MARRSPEVPGYIRLDGMDAECVYFSTYSWTRPESGIRHDIVVFRHEWTVRCTCEDATCRHKMGDLLGHGPDDQPNACKHIRAVVRWCLDLIPRERRK